VGSFVLVLSYHSTSGKATGFPVVLRQISDRETEEAGGSRQRTGGRRPPRRRGAGAPRAGRAL